MSIHGHGLEIFFKSYAFKRQTDGLQVLDELTCDSQHNSTKMHPPISLVALEVEVDILRVQSFENGGVMLGDVVDSNERDAHKPRAHGWREQEADLVCSLVLQREQEDEDDGGDCHHDPCTHGSTFQTA